MVTGLRYAFASGEFSLRTSRVATLEADEQCSPLPGSAARDVIPYRFRRRKTVYRADFDCGSKPPALRIGVGDIKPHQSLRDSFSQGEASSCLPLWGKGDRLRWMRLGNKPRCGIENGRPMVAPTDQRAIVGDIENVFGGTRCYAVQSSLGVCPPLKLGSAENPPYPPVPSLGYFRGGTAA